MKLDYNVNAADLKYRRKKVPNEAEVTIESFLKSGEEYCRVRYSGKTASIYQSLLHARKSNGFTVDIIRRQDKLFLAKRGE